MRHQYLILTGTPASGKSTIGRALSEKLELEMLDKDEILEDLFNEKTSEMYSGEGHSAGRLMRFFVNGHLNPTVQSLCGGVIPLHRSSRL